MDKDNSAKFEILLMDFRPVGSLRIYTLQTFIEYANKTPPVNIYWADDIQPQGCGPFTTTWDAMENYKYMIGLRKNLALPVPAVKQNVVSFIEFKSKKANKRIIR